MSFCLNADHISCSCCNDIISHFIVCPVVIFLSAYVIRDFCRGWFKGRDKATAKNITSAFNRMMGAILIVMVRMIGIMVTTAVKGKNSQ